jgi:glutamate---cysteine ligase / carboxylate-amine ligase
VGTIQNPKFKIETARYAGMFDIIRDIHWDLRPQPDLGTLEVRVMDAQPTIKESIMLAAFIRMLVENP